jgi:hypothetical protein
MEVNVQSEELTEVKRRRDSVKQRIHLKRGGRMTTCMGTPCVIDTTDMSILQDEDTLAALDRKIARLEKSQV